MRRSMTLARPPIPRHRPPTLSGHTDSGDRAGDGARTEPGDAAARAPSASATPGTRLPPPYPLPRAAASARTPPHPRGRAGRAARCRYRRGTNLSHSRSPGRLARERSRSHERADRDGGSDRRDDCHAGANERAADGCPDRRGSDDGPARGYRTHASLRADALPTVAPPEPTATPEPPATSEPPATAAPIAQPARFSRTRSRRGVACLLRR